MITYYTRKSLEIVKNEGFIKFLKRFMTFVFDYIDPLYIRRFRYYTFKNNLINKIQYDVPTNAYDTIQICPTDIKHKLGFQKTERQDWVYPPPRHGGIGQIKDGEWDNPKYHKEINNLPRIRGFEERFVENKDWKDTQYYDWLLKKAKNDKRHEKFGFETLEQYMEKNFVNYEKLYNNIKEEGYKKGHKEARKEPGKRNVPNNKDMLEVLVCIDRKGDIYLAEGHNRFAIARVLDLEIPAQVVVRHKQWQKLRDDIYKNGLTQKRRELREHPDLKDILT